MPRRGDGAPHSVIIPISEIRGSGSAANIGGPPGTDAARFYAPSLPDSKGIVIRSARVFVSDEVGTSTASAVFNVMNQTTTMLSTSLTVTAVGSNSFTLAENGQEIITPGRYVRIDASATSATTWTSTYGFTGVSVQLDFDRLGS